jgi:hypothetical protein
MVKTVSRYCPLYKVRSGQVGRVYRYKLYRITVVLRTDRERGEG